MEPPVRKGSRADPAAIRQAIERFIEAAKKPALLEAGEECIVLAAGNYALEERAPSLTLQAWDERRNLVRRIVAIEGDSNARLDLRIERFGKKLGVLSLVDLNRSGGERLELRTARLEFREQFRRFLRRQFPDFRIAELSTEANLEESLSPVYARALLRSGTSAWAAIGGGLDCLNVDGILTFGLIWLDYLRRRERGLTVYGLILLLPAGRERTTCLRLRFMNSDVADYRAFAYTSDGVECALDLADYGNVDTRLEPPHSQPRQSANSIGDESWLESLVRANLEVIDARLLPDPVYGQAPTFAAGSRGIIDLLAADRDGRLAILELKASEDIHLPLQALDYWIRVKWHLDRNEFAAAGYFPGIALRGELAPRILFVAPALDIHPSNERILRYLSPGVEVERIGVGSEWQHGLKVMFRM